MAQAQAKLVLSEQQAHDMGINTAAQFVTADVKASQTKRQILIKAAGKVAHDDALIKQFLTGYEEGFVNAGQSEQTAAQRKTEAKAVILAFAATLVSGENAAKLEKFEGHYNEFISLARELKGKQNKGNNERRREPKLTAIQQDKVQDGIDKATPQQIIEITDSAVRSLVKNAPPTLAGFNSLIMIQQACTALLKNEAIEPIFKDAAKQIDAIVGKVIDQARKAQEAAAEAGKKQPLTTVKETEPETAE